MRFEIVFSLGAEKDFDEITFWYRAIRSGLDLDFILCLENELEVIRREPKLYEQIKKNIHRAVIHRFPYIVYYIVDDQKIVVIAITHHKRSKNTIIKKLKRK